MVVYLKWYMCPCHEPLVVQISICQILLADIIPRPLNKFHCIRCSVFEALILISLTENMITDVQLAVFANVLGVTVFLLVLLYHFIVASAQKKISH